MLLYTLRKSEKVGFLTQLRNTNYKLRIALSQLKKATNKNTYNFFYSESE